MAGNELEIALRNALARGDASNPAFRQRVYRAALEALERNIASQPGLGPEKTADQKRRLATAIRAAEAAYQPAAAAPRPARPAPSADFAADVRPEPRFADPGAARSAPPVTGLRADPRPERRQADTDVAPAERDGRPRRRRAPFAAAFSLITFVALFGIGGWWIYTTGAWKPLAERDGSVPNPPLQLQNESFSGTNRDPGTATAPATLPSAGSSRDEGWMTLFQPSDPTTLSLEGAASATIESDAIGQYARIVSPDRNSAVSVDVPPGTLEALAGKTAQFSLIARSDIDKPTQMSVTCDLGAFGDCGRLRFSVTQNDNEFLFRVDLPKDAASTRSGNLSIVTDVENKGRAVKLIGVRVRELVQ